MLIIFVCFLLTPIIWSDCKWGGTEVTKFTFCCITGKMSEVKIWYTFLHMPHPIMPIHLLDLFLLLLQNYCYGLPHTLPNTHILHVASHAELKTVAALRSTLFREQTSRLLEPARKKAEWNTGQTREGGLVTWNPAIVEITTHRHARMCVATTSHHFPN